MKKLLPTLILINLTVFLIMITACEHNRLKTGEQLFSQKRYAAAIQQLDRFIHTGKNGAYVTRAELIRSSCYFELGKAAVGMENWNLAIRLFKLANSFDADLELAKVYRVLAVQAINKQDIPRAMSFFSLILNETSNSDLVPEVLQLRISLFLDYYGDKNSAWNEYMNLYELFPENPFEIAARSYVQRFIEININEAVAKAIQKDYSAALEDLFQIRRYPTGSQERVDREISNIYQELAENELQKREYMEANNLYLKALQYNPQKKETIEKRLREIAFLYVEKGNDFLRIRDFSNALTFYQQSFEIIPEYDEAIKAIANMRTIQDNIRKASELAAEAHLLELARKYSESRNLYLQAYQLDRLPYYAENASIMSNLIEAEKNPVNFARRIITEYRNGMLTNRIQEQKKQMLLKYARDEIRDSGWKILLSTGQNKYEARYDLISPTDSFFFIWQINLRDRSVIPLNGISEKIMQ